MQGHIIDSGALMKVMDRIMDPGGEFEIEEQRYGRRTDEPSYVRLQVKAPSDKVLEQVQLSCQALGANPLDTSDVHADPAPREGAIPGGFYSTTTLHPD